MYNDSVCIEGLSVYTKIGVHADECAHPQLLSIDLKVTVDFSRAFVSDSLKDTVDYDFLSEHVKDFCQTSCFSLIEALAGAVIHKVFSIVDVDRVKIKIRKPGALLSGALASVVCERTRNEIKVIDNKYELLNNMRE